MTGKETLLIVDDEVDILNSLKRLLRKEPYTVLLANSGQKALSVIQKEKVEAIIADQCMPGMTGVELLEKIKQIDPDSVRIILSGYSDFNAIQDAINRGKIFRFLSKPWDEEEIKNVILSAFEHRRVWEENKMVMKRLIEENVKLKNDLSNRQNSLVLTNEILDVIDAPLFVLNKDFKIALKNSAATVLLSSLRQGNQATDEDAALLPPEYTDLIAQCLKKENMNWHYYKVLGQKKAQLQIRPLRSHDDYSCVLIFRVKS